MKKSNKYGNDYALSFHKVGQKDAELLSKFKCEYPAICHFIQEESIDDNNCVSYIFVDDTDNVIIGFCSICCSGILVSDKDEKGEPFTTSIPSVKIEYFAVDEEYRGIKLSEDSDRYETLSKAFMIFIKNHIRIFALNTCGAAHICLYSVPMAINFYKRCGFEPFEEYMIRDGFPFLDGCTPMFCEIERE